MATPPSSPPPPLESAAPFPSTSKKTRKVTRVRSLAIRAVGAKRPMVHVDPTPGNVDGPHRKKLRTYLGIVTCDKVDNWKQIPAAQKDLIWEDIHVFQLNVVCFVIGCTKNLKF